MRRSNTYTLNMAEREDGASEEPFTFRLLLECKHSKRVVELKCAYDSLQSHLEREVSDIVGKDVELLFDSSAATSTTKPAYLLQRYSNEWKDYTNVVCAIDIDLKEKLKAVEIARKEVYYSY